MIDATEFICQNCGHTTPVPDDNCSVCGSQLIPADQADTKSPKLNDSNQDGDENFRDISLDQLLEEEQNSDEPPIEDE